MTENRNASATHLANGPLWLRIFQKVATAADMLLKPLGRVLWVTYDFNEETGRVSIVALRIGRRPSIQFPR